MYKMYIVAMVSILVNIGIAACPAGPAVTVYTYFSSDLYHGQV